LDASPDQAHPKPPEGCAQIGDESLRASTLKSGSSEASARWFTRRRAKRKRRHIGKAIAERVTAGGMKGSEEENQSTPPESGVKHAGRISSTVVEVAAGVERLD
jgi:hypothetical protein